MRLRQWLRTVPDRTMGQVAWRVSLVLIAVSIPAAACMIVLPAPWGEWASIAIVLIPCAYFLAIGIWPGARDAHLAETREREDRL